MPPNIVVVCKGRGGSNSTIIQLFNFIKFVNLKNMSAARKSSPRSPDATCLLLPGKAFNFSNSPSAKKATCNISSKVKGDTW